MKYRKPVDRFTGFFFGQDNKSCELKNACKNLHESVTGSLTTKKCFANCFHSFLFRLQL